MYQAHKYLLTLLLCCAMCSGMRPGYAQEAQPDSLLADTSQTAIISNDATPIKGEYAAPEAPVVYNTAAPGAAQWREATSDKAYGYRDKREYIARKEKPRQDSWLIQLLIGIFEFLTSALGKAILWCAFILIVGYVAFRILKGQGGLFAARDRKPVADDGPGVLTEQSLLEMDWEHLLQESLRAGDSRATVRYSYLRGLQLLQEQNLIAYRPDKTNADYYRELSGKPQRQAFRDITRQYEWAWYGNLLPAKEALERYLQTFHQLKHSLGSE